MRRIPNKEYRLLLRKGGSEWEILDTNCPTVALDAKDAWAKQGFEVILYLVTYEELEG